VVAEANQLKSLTPLQVNQKMQEAGMCDIGYARRKAQLKQEYVEGLTPENSAQKMATWKAKLKQLEESRKAWQAWRASSLKAYEAELAKLPPAERRRINERAAAQARAALQDALNNLNRRAEEMGLTALNLLRAQHPQLGAPLSQGQWRKLSTQERKRLLDADAAAVKRLEGN
jgi:transketolase